MNPVLFLDFDGVLNNTQWFFLQHKKRKEAERLGKVIKYSHHDQLDPGNLRNLENLVNRVPGLLLTISSTWRKGKTIDELRNYLTPYVQRSRVVGITPDDPSQLRHVEITRWLKSNEGKVGAWAAVDDDIFDMIPLGENFFHVDRERGLTHDRVNDVVEFFKRKS